TEKNADYGAQSGQKSSQGCRRKGEGGNCRDGEDFRGRTQKGGQLPGSQGSQNTGNQGGVMHNAHRNYLHGKNGGSHGSPENRGKSSAHAAHNHNMLIFFIHPEELSQKVSNASAKLEGGSFAASGSSE